MSHRTAAVAVRATGREPAPGDDEAAGHLFPSPRQRLDHDLYDKAFRAWVPLVTAVLQAAHHSPDQGIFDAIESRSKNKTGFYRFHTAAWTVMRAIGPGARGRK